MPKKRKRAAEAQPPISSKATSMPFVKKTKKKMLTSRHLVLSSNHSRRRRKEVKEIRQVIYIYMYICVYEKMLTGCHRGRCSKKKIIPNAVDHFNWGLETNKKNTNRKKMKTKCLLIVIWVWDYFCVQIVPDAEDCLNIFLTKSYFLFCFGDKKKQDLVANQKGCTDHSRRRRPSHIEVQKQKKKW